jgi:hypothetical protein
MRKLVYCCLTLLFFCCKEKYDAPVNTPVTGYLVIEGYISTNGPAELQLSRSIPLDDTAQLIRETTAQVRLQGRDNTTYNFIENGPGRYVINNLNLNTNQQYRLTVRSRDGKEYASDYVSPKIAPQIDSVGWIRENGGVQIYINTHDPKNNTWYYRWTTEETWEFHSSFYTSLDYLRNAEKRIIGVKFRRPDQNIDPQFYTCWRDQNSTSLILGSSKKLSIDSIHKPLIYIEPRSWKLSVLYTVLVKQYALSKEEYEFLDKMKKNSEETGSFFGRQPSELKGNIHCVTNPNEPVIGFIGIANRMEKRIWIKRSDVPDWNYFQDCFTYTVPTDSAEFYSYLMPTVPVEYENGGVKSYLGASPVCVDCMLRGVNTKPSFWP